MATPNTSQRLLFTFRRNGDSNGKRLVEITAEPVEQHEASAGAPKQSWFGAEDDVAETMKGLRFPSGDVEGVVAALHTNRVATREWAAVSSELKEVGFTAST